MPDNSMIWSLEELKEANNGSIPTAPPIDTSGNPLLRDFAKVEPFWHLNRFIRSELMFADLVHNIKSKHLPAALKTFTKYQYRKVLCHRYAWAIPTDSVIEKICEHSPIVEIGAGKGYWASLIRQHGGDIVAYEKRIPSGRHKSKRRYNSYCNGGPFTTLKRGNAKRSKKHPDRALFLCWPEYSTSMAYDALRSYEGDTVLYVGEGDGGCCGSDDFWTLLEMEFEETYSSGVPQWDGINDYFSVYKRVRKVHGMGSVKDKNRREQAYEREQLMKSMKKWSDQMEREGFAISGER